MPRLIYSSRALVELDRCRRFLANRNETAARRAADTISEHLDRLETFPAIGRPLDGQEHLRELTIPFGRAGYVAMYRHDPTTDEVQVLAFKHQREAGY